MLMPSIFGENLFDDDWMNFGFNDNFWGKKKSIIWETCSEHDENRHP